MASEIEAAVRAIVEAVPFVVRLPLHCAETKSGDESSTQNQVTPFRNAPPVGVIPDVLKTVKELLIQSQTEQAWLRDNNAFSVGAPQTLEYKEAMRLLLIVGVLDVIGCLHNPKCTHRPKTWEPSSVCESLLMTPSRIKPRHSPSVMLKNWRVTLETFTGALAKKKGRGASKAVAPGTSTQIIVHPIAGSTGTATLAASSGDGLARNAISIFAQCSRSDKLTPVYHNVTKAVLSLFLIFQGQIKILLLEDIEPMIEYLESQTFFKELPPELQNDMVEELREIGNPQKIMLGLHLAVTISPMMLLTGVQWHKHNMDRSNVIHELLYQSQFAHPEALIKVERRMWEIFVSGALGHTMSNDLLPSLRLLRIDHADIRETFFADIALPKPTAKSDEEPTNFQDSLLPTPADNSGKQPIPCAVGLSLENLHLSQERLCSEWICSHCVTAFDKIKVQIASGMLEVTVGEKLDRVMKEVEQQRHKCVWLLRSAQYYCHVKNEQVAKTASAITSALDSIQISTSCGRCLMKVAVEARHAGSAPTPVSCSPSKGQDIPSIPYISCDSPPQALAPSSLPDIPLPFAPPSSPNRTKSPSSPEDSSVATTSVENYALARHASIAEGEEITDDDEETLVKIEWPEETMDDDDIEIRAAILELRAEYFEIIADNVCPGPCSKATPSKFFHKSTVTRQQDFIKRVQSITGGDTIKEVYRLMGRVIVQTVKNNRKVVYCHECRSYDVDEEVVEASQEVDVMTRRSGESTVVDQTIGSKQGSSVEQGNGKGRQDDNDDRGEHVIADKREDGMAVTETAVESDTLVGKLDVHETAMVNEEQAESSVAQGNVGKERGVVMVIETDEHKPAKQNINAEQATRGVEMVLELETVVQNSEDHETGDDIAGKGDITHGEETDTEVKDNEEEKDTEEEKGRTEVADVVEDQMEDIEVDGAQRNAKRKHADIDADVTATEEDRHREEVQHTEETEEVDIDDNRDGVVEGKRKRIKIYVSDDHESEQDDPDYDSKAKGKGKKGNQRGKGKGKGEDSKGKKKDRDDDYGPRPSKKEAQEIALRKRRKDKLDQEMKERAEREEERKSKGWEKNLPKKWHPIVIKKKLPFYTRKKTFVDFLGKECAYEFSTFDRRSDAIVENVDLQMRRYLHNGVPDYDSPDPDVRANSSVAKFQRAEWNAMSPHEQARIHGRQHIMIVEPGSEGYDLIRMDEGLLSTVANLDEPVTLQDQTIREEGEFLRTDVPRKILEHMDGVETALNALDLPMAHLNAPVPESLSCGNAAIVFTERKVNEYVADDSPLYKPANFGKHLSFALASTANTFHKLHVDPEGVSTVFTMKCGKKLLVVMDPHESAGGVRRFTSAEPYGGDWDIDKPNWKAMRPTGVMLGKGMSFYMMPNTPHFVITPQASIVLGGHYIPPYNIEGLMVGMVQTCLRGPILTNTEHPDCVWQLISRILVTWSHHIRESKDWYPPMMPDIKTMEGHREVGALLLLIALMPMLVPNSTRLSFPTTEQSVYFQREAKLLVNYMADQFREVENGHCYHHIINDWLIRVVAIISVQSKDLSAVGTVARDRCVAWLQTWEGHKDIAATFLALGTDEMDYGFPRDMKTEWLPTRIPKVVCSQDNGCTGPWRPHLDKDDKFIDISGLFVESLTDDVDM